MLMTTMMCPNCRHRFPVPGCCNAGPQCYGGAFFPPNFSENHCFPRTMQTNGLGRFQRWKEEEDSALRLSYCKSNQLNTTCDLTGGTVTITTPKIQSGGCLIECSDGGIFAQLPRIEIRPKLSGGSCLVQKRLACEDLSSNPMFFGNLTEDYSDVRYSEEVSLNHKETEEIRLIPPPSGCQELPGIRRNSSVKMPENSSSSVPPRVHSSGRTGDCCCTPRRNFSDNDPSTSWSTNVPIPNSRVEATCGSSGTTNSESMQIRVNATVQIPSNIGGCTVNITTTTNPRMDTGSTCVTVTKSSNNFNGGGLIQMDTAVPSGEQRQGETPVSPVSWFVPFLYESDTSPKDHAKLVEIKRLLNNSGWYHEELSWQQSKDLLKNAPIGQWLMRNSSDARYTFAVSVQTSKGPTSVRVFYAYGQFRLDSDPRLVGSIRSFDCPIKMLEHYSKVPDYHRDEVWVDNSGTFFSQIILTKPLVKEVRSLSHLARLVINKYKINTQHLPSLIKDYIADYPYAF